MLKRLVFLWIISGTVILCACGTNKKIEAAHAQTDQANKRADDLAARNADLQKQVASLTSANQQVNSEFSQYRANCETTSKRLKDLQDELKEMVDVLDKVEKRIEEGMADFKSKGVDVEYRPNGFVYVSMKDELMYKSGSSKVSEEGKKALSNLATVLNEYPKLKVIVLGHTDDRKFKTGSDNWSLSTERANGIVRTLSGLNVDPSRLTSGGQGKHNPVADNSTAEGRAQNRRTEIILNPDMTALLEYARSAK
jgi:chemotaxis protein MotB